MDLSNSYLHTLKCRGVTRGPCALGKRSKKRPLEEKRRPFCKRNFFFDVFNLLIKSSENITFSEILRPPKSWRPEKRSTLPTLVTPLIKSFSMQPVDRNKFQKMR
jgi:hypothetical protein